MTSHDGAEDGLGPGSRANAAATASAPPPAPTLPGAGGPPGGRMVVFTVFGDPVGQGAISHNRAGRGYHTNSAALRPWRAAVRQAGERATGHHSFTAPPRERRCAVCRIARGGHGLFLGAVALDVVAVFARPRTAPGRAFPTTIRTGDWDHHARSIGDALTGLLWADDAQIVDGHLRQVYLGAPGVTLPRPGALIRAWEVTEP